MARIAKSPKAVQLFRGGLNDISKNPWVQNLGGDCCNPAIAVDQDRLNPTINPENANIHTRPLGNRDYWRYSDGNDTLRRQIVQHINTAGVGAQLEILVIPTFALVTSIQVVTLAEESGLVFKLKTRNGTVIPVGQKIKVSETDSGDGCGAVARVKAAADKDDLGALAGASRVHNLFVSDIGGEFALEADALILEVKSLPATAVTGSFDIMVHLTYIAPGRSEATL